MGNQSRNGGVIIFVPGGRGRPAQTISAGISRRGETVGETVARINRGERVPRGARVLTLSGDDVAAYGGSTGFRDAEISDIMRTADGRRLVEREARTIGRVAGERIAGEETRSAANERRAAARVQRAQARVQELQREDRREKAARNRLVASGAGPRSRAVREADRRIAALGEELRSQRSIARGG